MYRGPPYLPFLAAGAGGQQHPLIVNGSRGLSALTSCPIKIYVSAQAVRCTSGVLFLRQAHHLPVTPLSAALDLCSHAIQSCATLDLPETVSAGDASPPHSGYELASQLSD
jgi:hypothetical protein